MAKRPCMNSPSRACGGGGGGGAAHPLFKAMWCYLRRRGLIILEPSVAQREATRKTEEVKRGQQCSLLQ